MSYTQILYPQLRELLTDGAQLIEVLPAVEYAELHLPGARNIPLTTLDAHSTSGRAGRRPRPGRGEVPALGVDARSCRFNAACGAPRGA